MKMTMMMVLVFAEVMRMMTIPCCRHESKSYHHFPPIDAKAVQNHVLELATGRNEAKLTEANG